MDAMKYRLILSTVPNQKTGAKIAKALVRDKFCACVNVIPKLSSFYWWKGKIESSNETLLLIKTTQSKVAALIRALKKIHPYETPEIISLEIKEGWKGYLDWIASSVK